MYNKLEEKKSSDKNALKINLEICKKENKTCNSFFYLYLFIKIIII